MKKVLLTGASGFIGRQTIPFLLKNGYEVHAVFYPEKTGLDDEHNLFWHRCNLLNPDEQKELLLKIKPDNLMHFSWYTTPDKYWNSFENLRWVGASLELVINFVENGGRRAIFAGSCAEYDWNYEYCSEESTPLNPATVYGTCKKSLYELLKSYAKQSGLSFAWGRVFFLYGPYEHPARLVSSAIISLLKNKPFACSHCNQLRDFLFVQDVAEAFVSLLESKLEGAVNIGSGKPVALKAIVDSLAKQLGRPELIEFGKVTVSTNEPVLLAADIKRITKELGWKPKYGLQKGLLLTIDWWRDNLKR